MIEALHINMAVSFATYGNRGWFVDNHNFLVDMYEGDRLAGDRYFVPATIHTSGFWPKSASDAEQNINDKKLFVLVANVTLVKLKC